MTTVYSNDYTWSVIFRISFDPMKGLYLDIWGYLKTEQCDTQSVCSDMTLIKLID